MNILRYEWNEFFLLYVLNIKSGLYVHTIWSSDFLPYILTQKYVTSYMLYLYFESVRPVMSIIFQTRS